MAAPCDERNTFSVEQVLGQPATFKQSIGVCKLCLRARASYTCPRCNVSYCSLSCYKGEKHSECSESFYKQNFIQALKETKGSHKDKERVLEMLRRLEMEEPTVDSDDEDEEVQNGQVESLERRLAGLDLDKEPEKVWDKLTPEERREFDEVLQGGGIGAMLEEWDPWWTNHDRELISELGNASGPEKRPKVPVSQPPKTLDSVPSLSELIKTRPSPLVAFNLVNILYCYAFVAVLYNGSHMEIPLHAIQSFVEICSVVSAKASFSCTEDAIESAIHTITQLKSLPSERVRLVAVVKDVVHILLGRSRSSPAVYVEAALSDLHELLKRSRAIYKKYPESKQESISKSKSAIFQAKKKVLFYLAWTRENPGVLKDRAADVKLLHRSMELDLIRHSQVKTLVEKNLPKVKENSSQKLIEELD
ncbi:zinc finger HIT domain-containing protein 2-like [Diadema setosum]|uniref:zinc finger HIT domain-containing protein 2-like n=1 Tax=Diadema setosum TaxID=31175 RepID=UPI003B3BC58E